MTKNNRKIQTGSMLQVSSFKFQVLFGLVLSLVLVWCLLPLAVKAGFGVSPPYVRNESLTRGSHYEQKIVIVRGDPNEDLKAEITTDVPGADDWISIDKGTEFILPKDQQNVVMFISVDVPQDAKYDRYKGKIRIATSSFADPEAGTVAIALGVQIDVDLNVSKLKIFDFKVRSVNVFDLEEGKEVWWWYAPGTIKMALQIENIGNIKSAPTKVHLDIYDSSKQVLVESVDDTKLAKVKPFETKKIIAEFPTKLGPGSYWTKFQIFRNEDIVSQGDLHLSILPKGALPAQPGQGISFVWLVVIVVVVIIVLVGFGYLVLKKRKRR